MAENRWEPTRPSAGLILIRCFLMPMWASLNPLCNKVLATRTIDQFNLLQIVFAVTLQRVEVGASWLAIWSVVVHMSHTGCGRSYTYFQDPTQTIGINLTVLGSSRCPSEIHRRHRYLEVRLQCFLYGRDELRGGQKPSQPWH
jgi:hypothetical protein